MTSDWDVDFLHDLLDLGQSGQESSPTQFYLVYLCSLHQAQINSCLLGMKNVLNGSHILSHEPKIELSKVQHVHGVIDNDF